MKIEIDLPQFEDKENLEDIFTDTREKGYELLLESGIEGKLTESIMDMFDSLLIVMKVLESIVFDEDYANIQEKAEDDRLDVIRGSEILRITKATRH
jgi:hypothetical protein|tara:strand:- start:1240 stop:1530 length:291 start_codon:yes stop_codon:yes gene_type:complete